MSAEIEQHVTRVDVADFPLPNDGLLTQLTLTNGSQRPTTLGPQGLQNLRLALERAQERAAAGEIHAVAVTGMEPWFLAGADLTVMETVSTRDEALELAQAGHETFALLADMSVPTFAFISGAALGGGLELALHCDYRVIMEGKSPLALPEVALGILPGWGGCWLLPRLVGIRAATEIIVSNPLKNNRQLRPAQAVQIGLVDDVLPAPDFTRQARGWAEKVITGEVVPARRDAESRDTWEQTLATARSSVESRLQGAAPAPYRALDLLLAAHDSSRAEGFAAENAALSDLIMTAEFHASLYAFNLVNRAGKRTLAAVETDPFPVMKAGIVGAGLMATQLARVLAQNLAIDVVMRDLDSERVTAGLNALQSELDADVESGRLDAAAAQEIRNRVHGTTDISEFAGCQLVIEAVTEKMEIKKAVFAELEETLEPTAVLATNTSALSVHQMANELGHPERVIGLHFFNPVARMPLVEVVRTPQTNDLTLATALSVVQSLRKSGVVVQDAPGFVVNRILLRFLAEIFAAADRGVPLSIVDSATGPMGLPMSPFALLDLVGPPVAEYVLESLHENLGERYALSPGLRRIAAEKTPIFNPEAPGKLAPELEEVFANNSDPTTSSPNRETAHDVLVAVQRAIGDEVARMVDEKIVANVEDIDLAMILGAGWPLFLGGITPYLRRVGVLDDQLRFAEAD